MDYKDFMNVKNWPKNKSKDQKEEIALPDPVEPEIPAEISAPVEKPKTTRTRKPRTTKKAEGK